METAFLNGEKLGRELYVPPPLEIAGAGVNSAGLWRIKKGVLGLTDAPPLWWLQVRSDLLATGWTELRGVAATFALFSTDGRLQGLLAVSSMMPLLNV